MILNVLLFYCLNFIISINIQSIQITWKDYPTRFDQLNYLGRNSFAWGIYNNSVWILDMLTK